MVFVDGAGSEGCEKGDGLREGCIERGLAGKAIVVCERVFLFSCEGLRDG